MLAVYTHLSVAQVNSLLRPVLDGAPVLDLQGVGAGVENSTYFVTVDSAESPRELVLTIAESQDFESVAAIARWQQRLAAAGAAVPAPLRGLHTEPLLSWQGKPVLAVPRCSGTHVDRPTPAQCAAIGGALGTMHEVALSSAIHFDSSRGLAWLRRTAESVLPPLQEHYPDLAAELADELAWFDRSLPWLESSPTGIIHGDLFRDNALFEDEGLTGIIDFFMAGTGPLMLDVAIAANDWCSAADGTLTPDLHAALIHAYADVRPPTTVEQQRWPDFLRLAALRFWVSRLADRWLATDAQRRLHGKDPTVMHQLLRLRKGSNPPEG